MGIENDVFHILYKVVNRIIFLEKIYASHLQKNLRFIIIIIVLALIHREC
jgi:hypothetical protein